MKKLSPKRNEEIIAETKGRRRRRLRMGKREGTEKYGKEDYGNGDDEKEKSCFKEADKSWKVFTCDNLKHRLAARSELG